MPLKIVLASNNTGKLKEFQQLLAGRHFDVLPQAQFRIDDVEETGLSFVENAIIKARHALPMIRDWKSTFFKARLVFTPHAFPGPMPAMQRTIKSYSNTYMMYPMNSVAPAFNVYWFTFVIHWTPHR